MLVTGVPVGKTAGLRVAESLQGIAELCQHGGGFSFRSTSLQLPAEIAAGQDIFHQIIADRLISAPVNVLVKSKVLPAHGGEKDSQPLRAEFFRR